MAAIFTRIYTSIDSVLLSNIAGDVAVGWYSIPHKIVGAFQFIPGALIAALYPRFSEYYIIDKKRLSYFFQLSMKYLLIIVFPIAVGIGILAEDIVITVFGFEYFNSILPLKILLFGMVCSFVGFPIGAMLNACNRQVTQTIITAVVMLVNILLNIILIPIFGVVGAAIASLVGNIIMVKIGYLVIPKITKISHRFIIKTIIQLFISAIVMGIVVWFVNQHWHFALAIVSGLIVYPIMLFLTNSVTKHQLKEVVLLIRK